MMNWYEYILLNAICIPTVTLYSCGIQFTKKKKNSSSYIVQVKMEKNINLTNQLNKKKIQYAFTWKFFFIKYLASYVHK